MDMHNPTEEAAQLFRDRRRVYEEALAVETKLLAEIRRGFDRVSGDFAEAKIAHDTLLDSDGCPPSDLEAQQVEADANYALVQSRHADVEEQERRVRLAGVNLEYAAQFASEEEPPF